MTLAERRQGGMACHWLMSTRAVTPRPSPWPPPHLPPSPQPKPRRDSIKTKLQKMAARLIKRKKE